MNKYETCASALIPLLGGKENIVTAAHCATRLRLVLKDEKKADVNGILNTDLVKGQFSNAGQFQIIIGSGTVNEVYKALIAQTGLSEASKADVKAQAAEKLNPIQSLVKLLSDVFVPLIPALVASGLLMGLNNVLTASGLFFPSMSLIEAYPGLADLAAMINTFASAAYAFLPVLIGFSAAKVFGGNPYLGAVIGMIMVSGDLLNAYGYGDAITNGTVPYWNVMGLAIEKVGYQGTVLPVLAAAWILSFLEKKLHKVIPEALDNLLTPLLAVMITGFLTFTLVGSIMRTAGDWLTTGMLYLYNNLGVIGGSLLGFVYAPLTVTGMHHSLMPIDIQLFAAGGSFLLAIAACNNVAQGGAALCAMLRTRDKKLKSVAASSGISALLGITEPAMFGVNLKLKYPFYAAMAGSAIGCAYVTLTHVINISPGAAGLIGFVCVPPECMLNFIIGVLISLVCGFGLTWLLSNMKQFQEEPPVQQSTPSVAPAAPVVLPLNEMQPVAKGHLVKLSDVPDHTFASGMLGNGFAIQPCDGEVCAPMNGKVEFVFDTKHAVGLTLDNGAEVLIHIGLDTVNLQGEGFTAHVKPGDRVKAGQKLISFDLDGLQKKGLNMIIPVIFTNPDYPLQEKIEDIQEMDVCPGSLIREQAA